MYFALHFKSLRCLFTINSWLKIVTLFQFKDIIVACDESLFLFKEQYPIYQNFHSGYGHATVKIKTFIRFKTSTFFQTRFPKREKRLTMFFCSAEKKKELHFENSIRFFSPCWSVSYKGRKKRGKGERRFLLYLFNLISE